MKNSFNAYPLDALAIAGLFGDDVEILDTFPGTALLELALHAGGHLGCDRLDEATVACRWTWTPATKAVKRLDHVRRLVHMAVPAPAGRSPRRLAGHYLERAYRLLRGRVRLKG